MNKIFLILCVIASCCLQSSGQTDYPPIPLHMFSLSPVKVRSLTSESEERSQARGAGVEEALQSRRDAAVTERLGESRWGEGPLEPRNLEPNRCHGSTESPVLRSSTAEGGRPIGNSSQHTTVLQDRDTNATVQPETVSPEVSSVTNPNLRLEQMTLINDESDFALRIYPRLERGGYFTRPERKSDNVFVRSLDAVFRPEVVHIGDISVSCSVITAIKRKNPLCLINPLVLHVSW